MPGFSDLLGTTETEFSIGRGKLLWLPTTDRTITIPDKDGTVVLLDSNGNAGGLTPAIAPGQAATYEQVQQPRRVGTSVVPSVVQYTPSAIAQAANSLRAFPFKLGGYRNFSGIRSEVATLLAGANYRVGIYSDNGSAYPATLLTNSDNGDISAAAAGVKPFTAAITAPSEWVWAVVNFSATVSMRTIPVTALSNLLGTQGNGGTNHCFTAWAIGQTFGPLPATFPAGATLQANLACPWVALVSS